LLPDVIVGYPLDVVEWLVCDELIRENHEVEVDDEEQEH
jgi:hypothetical protein